jgi:hypothetical protein
MIRTFLAILICAWPGLAAAETARLDIRYVEIDVTEHAEATEAFLASLEKARKASDGAGMLTAAKSFYESMQEGKAPIARDAQASVSLDEYGNGETRRGKGSGTESLAVTGHCRGSGDHLDVSIRCESPAGPGRKVRATSLGLKTAEFEKTVFYPEGVEYEDTGPSRTRIARFFVARLTSEAGN